MVHGALYMVPSAWCQKASGPALRSPEAHQHRKTLASETQALQQLWVIFSFTSSSHLEVAKSNSSVHRCPKHAINMP